MTHIIAYAGLVKRANSQFENYNNNPGETHVHGGYSTFWPRGQWALRARRPRGPNVKIVSTYLQYSMEEFARREGYGGWKGKIQMFQSDNIDVTSHIP